MITKFKRGIDSNTTQLTTQQLASELVTFPQQPRRLRRVNLWVDHFFSCSTCRKPGTSFPVEAKSQNELCEPGRELQNNWLNEE